VHHKINYLYFVQQGSFTGKNKLAKPAGHMMLLQIEPSFFGYSTIIDQHHYVKI